MEHTLNDCEVSFKPNVVRTRQYAIMDTAYVCVFKSFNTALNDNFYLSIIL